MTDPETGLPFGVGEDTGLPTTIGTGNLVDAQQAGSDQVSEAGTQGDPYYDPAADLFHFVHGTVAEPDFGDEIQMDATDVGPAVRDSEAQKEGSRVSAGFKGMTDAGIAQSDKLFGPAYGRANEKNQALSDQYAADVKRLQADTDTRKRVLAELAQSEIEHFNNVAEVRRQQVELNAKAGRAEELGAAQARANAEQYIAHYNQEMANLRPLLMQTGNPLGGLTAVQGGAMGAALFAQGFLGARYGIKVDVAGQIDRWVEQEMHAHQNKVSNMMAGANAQLKLYDIARQQGLDDQMTRDRLRGFAIDAFKANLYMEAARYQSATAQNDAKAKAAELDQLQLANEQGMRNNLIKQQMDVINAEIDAAYKQGSLSLQQRNADIDAWRVGEQAKQNKWERARADRKDQEAKDAQNGAPPVDMSWTEIVDPGKPIEQNGKITGYQTTWVLDPTFLQTAPKEVINDTIKDVQDASSAYVGIVKGLDSVRTYLQEHPDANKFVLKHGQITKSDENLEYERRFNAAVTDFRHSMFGGNLTESESSKMDVFNGANYLFQRGDNGPQALDDLENLARGKLESKIETKQGIRVNPTPGARRIDSMMNRTKARMAANDAPEAVETPAAKKEGRITGVDRNLNAAGNLTGPTVAERSFDSLGGQIVNGIANYNTVVEKRRGQEITGKDDVEDALNVLLKMRDGNDSKRSQEATRILRPLVERYPELASYPKKPLPDRLQVERTAEDVMNDQFAYPYPKE